MTKKIYLDAGHGGSDSGAVGFGLKEKDIVLKIVKYTRDYLNNNYTGHSIRLSRSTDKYLTLTQRTNDANNWGATVFVSFHINAGGGIGYEDFIFNGTVSNATKSLQNAIHKEVSKHFTKNRGKKRANFAVLRQSKMPAVLTECGFIDNKTDTDFLRKDSNLKKLGESHAKGIAEHLNLKKKSSSSSASKPSSSKPSDQLYRVRKSANDVKSQIGAYSVLKSAKDLADKNAGYKVYDDKGKLVYTPSKTHTVKSGETLWSIATKYKTTVSDIKKKNGLKSDTIRVGQKIKV